MRGCVEAELVLGALGVVVPLYSGKRCSSGIETGAGVGNADCRADWWTICVRMTAWTLAWICQMKSNKSGFLIPGSRGSCTIAMRMSRCGIFLYMTSRKPWGFAFMGGSLARELTYECQKV